MAITNARYRLRLKEQFVTMNSRHTISRRTLLGTSSSVFCLNAAQNLFAATPNLFPTPKSKPRRISGIYPHLAMFNEEDECGTGAVVPFADRLWVITYAPHKPSGSTDKLYEITTDLEQIVRPESIGGTCANRFIHRESNQLFIGPYVIDQSRNVRAIPFSAMFGRHTGTTRHLFKPETMVYTMTMEEGLYEVDVDSLAVNPLYYDEAEREKNPKANIAGYHGKGLYSSQGRLVYANNGEYGDEARTNPRTESGALAQWDGKDWSLVTRNQFTEVTGPGGIMGNAHPDEQIWSVGWDHKSLLLMCLSEGKWHRWRLPKASNSYDGAHGWNTEWPRIRDIGENDLLMTMHGMFWRFPRDFSPAKTSGITPRSRYLKVIGDFCQWNDQVVFGCDDTARSEFLNKRQVKGTIAAPQSQSNLWFLKKDQLDGIGHVTASGGLFENESVQAGQVSEAMLFGAFINQSLMIKHSGNESVQFSLEYNTSGSTEWQSNESLLVEPNCWSYVDLTASAQGNWVRIRTHENAPNVTAWFLFSEERKPAEKSNCFDGLATSESEQVLAGTLRARNHNRRTLHYLASAWKDETLSLVGLYELDGELNLRRSTDEQAALYEAEHSAIPNVKLHFDNASLLYVDDNGKRWRIPFVSKHVATTLLPSRICREVSTERDLFNAGGIFYELPAENAGGFAKVSPIASHNFQIADFCSYRGLLVIAGVDPNSRTESDHIVRSDDGQAAIWAGAVDDLWKLGEPQGQGGPWLDSQVSASKPSDPFLMWGIPWKAISLSHKSKDDVVFHVEFDVTGEGDWTLFERVLVRPSTIVHLPLFNQPVCRWMRVTSSADCIASCQLG